eukprot:scaffold6766_cov78-Phaeocystis_antarctica.AAC.1
MVKVEPTELTEVHWVGAPRQRFAIHVLEIAIPRRRRARRSKDGQTITKVRGGRHIAGFAHTELGPRRPVAPACPRRYQQEHEKELHCYQQPVTTLVNEM